MNARLTRRNVLLVAAAALCASALATVTFGDPQARFGWAVVVTLVCVAVSVWALWPGLGVRR